MRPTAKEPSGTALLKSGAMSLMSFLAPIWVTATSRRERMRILAYHDIPDREKFGMQMSYISEHFQPVTIKEVIRFAETGKTNERAVWITFDDGDPTVVANALPVLRQFEIQATMFICPSFVDTHRPFWWQIVEQADRAGLMSVTGHVSSYVTHLKSVPDDERRDVVRSLKRQLARSRGAPLERQQLTMTDLESWVAAGHVIQNHSWSHPILPMASEEEQHRQVVLAHEWINDRFPMEHPIFAYPNGDVSSFARGLLQQLGYEAAVLFDHRVAQPTDRLGLSRIRVNGWDNYESYRARVSGIHPALNSLRSRM